MKTSLPQGDISLTRTYVLSAPVTAADVAYAHAGATPEERRERLLSLAALVRWNPWAKNVSLSIMYDDDGEPSSREVWVTIAATPSSARRLARFPRIFTIEEIA
jgi:hypothetical protein